MIGAWVVHKPLRKKEAIVLFNVMNTERFSEV